MHMPGKEWRRLVPNAANLSDEELTEIANTKAGQRALAADKQSLTEAANSAKKVTLTRDGQPVTKIVDAEARDYFFSHPLYSTSKAFRDAVALAASNSSADELGINEQGQSSTWGRLHAVDAESMIDGARREAALAHRDKMFQAANGNGPDAAIARLAIIEMLASEKPEDQANVEFVAGQSGFGQRPLEDWTRRNKSLGLPTRASSTDDVPLHPKDISYETGKFVDGSEIPSGGGEDHDGI